MWKNHFKILLIWVNIKSDTRILVDWWTIIVNSSFKDFPIQDNLKERKKFWQVKYLQRNIVETIYKYTQSRVHIQIQRHVLNNITWCYCYTFMNKLWMNFYSSFEHPCVRVSCDSIDSPQPYRRYKH